MLGLTKRRGPVKTRANVTYAGVMAYMKKDIDPLAITPALQYAKADLN